jgi:chemotaxis protein MotB
MARKRTHTAGENNDRWLVSYADFITLMFALFVVMFASSQADQGRAQRVSESVQKALHGGQVASASAGVLGGTPGKLGKGNVMIKGPGGVNAKPTANEEKLQYMEELAPSFQSLSVELGSEIAAGKVALEMEPRGLVISLKEAAFFPTGQDTISRERFESIGKIAEALKKVPNPVRLEGHTDSVPIHNARFRSNWDLSVARGISMLTLLRERFEVPEKQLSVAGYADNLPSGPNETEEGRAHNRRVDVVILKKAGSEYEPRAEPARKL